MREEILFGGLLDDPWAPHPVVNRKTICSGGNPTPQTQSAFTNQSQSQQGKSVSQPFDFLQGPLRGLAMGNYDVGTTTDPYTPASANTQGFWNGASSFGTAGLAGGALDPLRDAYIANTLSGNGLDLSNNPYFQGAVGAWLQPATENFVKNIIPGIQSTFASQGRLGGGENANGQMLQQATTNFDRTTNDAMSKMSEDAYEQALNRQTSVLGMIPSFQAGDLNRDLTRLNLMGQAGQAQDAYNLSQKYAPMDLYNRTGLSMLGLYPGGVTDSSGSSSGNGTTYGYSMPGSSGNSGLGTGLGLAGLALQALPGIFSSDRRDKTDIDRLGIDPLTGLPLYAYRYKSDPKTYPKVVGPMAQDLAKRGGARRVREIGGHKVVMGGLV